MLKTKYVRIFWPDVLKKHFYQNFKYINCGSIYNISVWDALKKEIINVMSSCMIIIQIRLRSYNKLIVSNKGFYLNVR